MTAALCCVWRNRVGRTGAAARGLSIAGWTATTSATVFFILTLVTIPLVLAIEVGL